MKKTSIGLLTLMCLLIIGCRENSEPFQIKLNSGQYKYGVVASAHSLANTVGINVLKSGGNAFDAAVAVNMALAVTYPRAGNIGGGGFMVYRTANGESGSLDFREKAPENAHHDMFLNNEGKVIENLSRQGALSIGVPGAVAGMVALHEKFGNLEWSGLLNPSIDLAKNGFLVSELQAKTFNRFQDTFIQVNDGDIHLSKTGGWKKGDTLKSTALGKTLELIAREKLRGFYEGAVAEDIVNTIKANGGIISLNDLANYQVVWRKPVSGKFNGYEVISMPPPSSGGIALIQLLKGFEMLQGDTLPHNSALYIHLLTELERRVYADRAEYLGDPDFYPVPEEKLINTEYLQNRFSDINMQKATPSSEIKEGKVEVIESFETTHFEIVDRWGNAVSITTTLNGYFGSKLITKKSGIMLNNEMDDFSIKPGVPNQFGLVGSEANKIEPNKRMLSSMTPTIVLKNDSLVLLTGTPGGPTIITTVFQTLLNSLVYQMDVQTAVNTTKEHAQWLPDKIYFETDKMPQSRQDSLTNMGHNLFATPRLGKMKLILIDEVIMYGAGDTLRGDPPALGF